MEDILIRFAEKSDYENIEKIMKQVQRLHIGWRPDIYKECETVLPYEVFLDEISEETFVVAEIDGEIAGVLSYMQRHIESVNHVTREVFLLIPSPLMKIKGGKVSAQGFLILRKI